MNITTKTLLVAFAFFNYLVLPSHDYFAVDSRWNPLGIESPALRRRLFSPDGEPIKMFDYGLIGYIKNESFFDSSQDISFLQGQFFLYPAKPRLDDCGRNINYKGHFNMLAIESRLGVEMAGPQVFDARTFAVVIADALVQGTNLTIGRIRFAHAYMYFEWHDKSLLIGQHWHPLFKAPRFYPKVIQFNAGTPFELGSFDAQIRLTKKFGPMTLLLAACSRGTSLVNGPRDVASEIENVFIRNGILPNAHAQIYTEIDQHEFGFGIDVTRLVPRLATKNDKLRVSESLMSFIVIGFASLNWDAFTLNLKGIYAQNGFGYVQISGYAVHSRDKYTGEQTYTNTQCISAWADMYYKHPVIEPGLFLGFTKNIGACKSILLDPNEQTIFAGGQENIDYIARISSRIRWYKDPFVFGVELDLTQAAWGTVTNTGRVKDAVPVNNFRAMLATYYMF